MERLGRERTKPGSISWTGRANMPLSSDQYSAGAATVRFGLRCLKAEHRRWAADGETRSRRHRRSVNRGRFEHTHPFRRRLALVLCRIEDNNGICCSSPFGSSYRTRRRRIGQDPLRVLGC
jgi:hypothetical protein